MTDDERRAEKGQLLEEYQRLSEDYRLLKDRARRYGRTLRELGTALESHPERIRVAIEPGRIVVPDPDTFVVTSALPTLRQIDLLVQELRAAAARLEELRTVLGLS